MKILISIFFLVANRFFCMSQSIQGVVVDSISKEPIPYVHVYDTKFEIGTITNKDGQFIFNKKKENPEITFSHIGYTRKKFLVKKNETSLLISLAPKSELLSEVTIDDQGYKFAKMALIKLMNPNTASFGSAFYRQVTITGETPSGFIETFNNISSNPSGLEKSAIYQARYASAKSKVDIVHFSLSNFSYLTFGFKIFSTQQSDIAKPFDPNYFDDFTYTIKSYFEDNGIKYATILYDMSPKINRPSMVGDFTINTNTGSLVNFSATIKHSLGADSLTVNQPNQPLRRISLANHTYHWVCGFSDSTIPTLDFINVSFSASFILSNKPIAASVSSHLIVFEKDTKGKKGLKNPEINQKDINQIKKSKYNPGFWKNNPLIKRTHFEDEVISYFEKSNSFGTAVK